MTFADMTPERKKQIAQQIVGDDPRSRITALRIIDAVLLDLNAHAMVTETCAALPVREGMSQPVDDLAALVRRLAQALRKAAPDNALAERAVDYLRRQGLQGSALRTAGAAGPAGDAEVMKAPSAPAALWIAINDWYEAKLALAARRASGELMNADYIEAVTAAEKCIDEVACGAAVPLAECCGGSDEYPPEHCMDCERNTDVEEVPRCCGRGNRETGCVDCPNTDGVGEVDRG